MKTDHQEDLKKDILFLLGQLNTIEHAQDHKKIRELRKKYGLKKY